MVVGAPVGLVCSGRSVLRHQELLRFGGGFEVAEHGLASVNCC